MNKILVSTAAVALAAASFAGGAFWALNGATVSTTEGTYGKIVFRDASSLTIQLPSGLQKKFVLGPKSTFVALAPVLPKSPSDAVPGTVVQVFVDSSNVVVTAQLLLDASFVPVVRE